MRDGWHEMSFGIEFDIDEDEYEVTPNVAFNGHVGTQQPPVRMPRPAGGDILTADATPGTQQPKFERLFDLTSKIRQDNREAWLNQYASMRIQDTRADAPMPQEGEPSASPDLGTQPAVPSPDGTVATEAQGSQPADGKATEPLTMLVVLSRSSMAFAVMSVLFAMLPVVGLYALVLPGATAILLAVLSIAMAYGARKSVVLPVIALVLALASVAVAIGANGMYERLGLMHVTQGDAGTTVSLG